MKLYIDPRAGSEKFIHIFGDECESAYLPAGDIAFFGNGPANREWYVGIEHKQVSDLVSCIQSGRFAGTQLPGMLERYDICFLIVEGFYQPDTDTLDKDAKLCLPKNYGGKSAATRFGLSYKAFDNYCTSISVFTALTGKICIVKRTKDKAESTQVIRDLYAFFQKPWEDHKSMQMLDTTKMGTFVPELSIVRTYPGDQAYPSLILRKCMLQVEGVGWELAGAIADKFGTVEGIMQVSIKELLTVPGMGKTLAARVFQALHGCEDLSSAVVKKTPCDCFVETAVGSRSRKFYNPDCPKCLGKKYYKLEVITDIYGNKTERILDLGLPS